VIQSTRRRNCADKEADVAHGIISRLALTLAIIALTIAVPVLAAAQATATSPGSRTLYLIRHGLYDEADTRDEAVGQGLTEAGRRQAELTGARLAAMGVHFDTLWTSPLTRARETAAVIARSLAGLTPRLAPELAECTPPTWRKDIADTLIAKEAEACRAQLERAFARFFVPSPAGNRHELFICHGNVIRWLWCRALGVETAAWLGMSIANCSITVIQIRPNGSCKLYVFGDAGHLPLELQTCPGGTLPPWRLPSR
jgi:serine/threonine-protein phosphatase PGAM5